MKSFEEHIACAAYESGYKNGARRKRIEDRRLTREQRKAQAKRTMAFIAAVCMVLMALLAFLAAFTVPASADTTEHKKLLQALTTSNKWRFWKFRKIAKTKRLNLHCLKRQPELIT